jgi:hypothetical protein
MPHGQILDARELAEGRQFNLHGFLAVQRFRPQSLEFTVAVLEVYQVHLWPEIE